VCVDTVAYCLDKGGAHADAEHVGVLLDCEQICRTAQDFMARGSRLHSSTCSTCAEACDACAEACESFAGDPAMEACAEACRTCADACRRAASTPMSHGKKRSKGKAAAA
jgi:hypothetical protein